jgi:hypothetical protein
LLPVVITGLLVAACSSSGKNDAQSTSSTQSPGTTQGAAVTPAVTNNPPWYPSLQAFEHYNSGRSHVFSMAEFNGSFTGQNKVDLVRSDEGAYPSGYNMSYLNDKDAFVQGGSYGNVKNSIGPYVAKVDPTTLKPIWFTQLRNTVQANEWDYPGGMAIESDGYMYVVSGYRMYKVDPSNGKVVNTLVLPTTVYMRNNYPNTPPSYSTTPTDDAANTSYNGLNALPDGTIVLKSLYRTAGCTMNGPTAILSCPDSQNIPASVLLTVNAKTMTIIDNITLPAPAPARPTITSYHGVDYVYLNEKVSNAVRYSVKDGKFTLDTSWTPANVPYTGQTTAGSLIVMGDWIVGATNSVPTTGALTVYAINQSDASKIYRLQPYINDPVAPELKKAFATAAAGQQAISWAGMSLEADAENGIFYGVETMARKIAAFKITDSGITPVWKETQTTTEWATLIGPKDHRVWVGTEIPGIEIPGQNKTDEVVFRDAATGKELARSSKVPYMTQGSAIQPGYGGSVFFPGATGMLIKVTPSAS